MQSVPPQIPSQIVGQIPTQAHGAQPGIIMIQNVTNSSATTGMVLGIVSMPLTVLSPLSFFLCCFFSIPLAFLGMIFSHAGYSKSKATGIGKGQAISGLILNWFQLLLVLGGIILMLFFGTQALDFYYMMLGDEW